MKCGKKWVDDGEVEPRYCPTCGSPTIYVPKSVTPPKYHA